MYISALGISSVWRAAYDSDETLKKRVEELVELLGRFGKKGVVVNDDLPSFKG